MAKFGLYSKNNLEELISIYNTNINPNPLFGPKINLQRLASSYFRAIKNLPKEEFDKLFLVKKLYV